MSLFDNRASAVREQFAKGMAPNPRAASAAIADTLIAQKDKIVAASSSVTKKAVEAGTMIKDHPGTLLTGGLRMLGSSRVTKTLLTAELVLFAADIWLDEPLDETEVGQFLREYLDAGWLVNFGADIAGVAARGSRLRVIAQPVVYAFRVFPWMVGLTKALIAKRSSGPSKPLRNFSVLRDAKAGYAAAVGRTGEILMRISKAGVELSPGLRSIMSQHGLKIAGGSALGLGLLGTSDKWADFAINDWFDTILSIFGEIDNTGYVDAMTEDLHGTSLHSAVFDAPMYAVLSDTGYYIGVARDKGYSLHDARLLLQQEIARYVAGWVNTYNQRDVHVVPDAKILELPSVSTSETTSTESINSQPEKEDGNSGSSDQGESMGADPTSSYDSGAMADA